MVFYKDAFRCKKQNPMEVSIRERGKCGFIEGIQGCFMEPKGKNSPRPVERLEVMGRHKGQRQQFSQLFLSGCRIFLAFN